MDEPESYKFCKLSLSHSLKCSMLFLFTLMQIWHVSFRARSWLHWLYWKKYLTGRNPTRDLIADSIHTDCIDLSWNTCICYGHSLLPLLQDWQLQVSGRRVFSVLVNSLLYKSMPPLYWRDSYKMLFPIPFCMDPTRKAIAVNSLLIVSCS